MENLTVNRIRTASRRLVRELGFLNHTIAGTRYSASAVHAVIEIGLMPLLTAKQLSEIRMLEKSTISRLVKSFVNSGEILEIKSEKDGREKHLKLTDKGEGTLREIHDFGNKQVSGALNSLSEYSKTTILEGLETYASALANNTANESSDFVICSGIKSGLISGVTELHAEYYSRVHGLNQVFEAEVATNLSEFILRLDHEKSEIWHVEYGGKIVASLAIDGEQIGGNKAFLRWFIVDEKLQSSGLGTRLMNAAMDFCVLHKFDETHLWTFEGLYAARKLYERNGFKLVEEKSSDKWGSDLTMQKFMRRIHKKG